MSEAASTPGGNPLENKYAPLRADLDGTRQGAPRSRLTAVTEALAADGWHLGRRFDLDAGAQDGDAVLVDLRKCLDVADALAVQCLAGAVGYRYENDGGGRHRFQVEEGGKHLVLIFEDRFLRDDLQESQAGVYVESLIRHLRDASGAGQALRVSTGCVERVPLPESQDTRGGTAAQAPA